jgi:hypothetical protein
LMPFIRTNEPRLARDGFHAPPSRGDVLKTR